MAQSHVSPERSLVPPWRVWIGLGTICFTVVFLMGSCSPANEDLSDAATSLSLPSVTMQQKQERVWPDINLGPLFELPTEPDSLLYNPVGARADNNGNIYVVDYGVMKVRRFDSSGRSAGSYGMGVGEGPGEFVNILDWGVTSDSMVYIADNAARKISFFDINGAFTQSQQFVFAPVRYVITPEGRSYTIVSHLDHVFESRKNEDVVVFGSMNGSNRPGPGLNTGMLTTFGERMLFAPIFYPVIVQYNTDGSVHYARATPDWGGVDDPYWKEEEIRGMRGYRPIGQPIQGDLSVYEDTLFVHASPPNTEEEVIDVYEARTGDYEYSIRLPQRSVRSVHTYVMNDRVYQVLETGTVAVYSIEW